MALGLNRGAAAIAAAAERSGSGKFMPNFKWEAGETKYLQFITPIEDVPTVLYHNFIITDIREDGSKVYSSFISRRDEAIDGTDGYDPLIDRFQEQPTRRSIALAVELEPLTETNGTRKTIVGFDVATRQFEREGETVTVPNVALVIQSPSIFFGYLATFSDVKPIESTIFAIKRVGKKTDTRYDIVEVPGATTLDMDGILDEVGFDFDAYLEDLASEERMRELIDPLPDDFEVNPYNKKRKNKKASSGTAARSTRTRTTTTTVEEAEEQATTDAAPRSSRSRRFAALETELSEPEPDAE